MSPGRRPPRNRRRVRAPARPPTWAAGRAPVRVPVRAALWAAVRAAAWAVLRVAAAQAIAARQEPLLRRAEPQASALPSQVPGEYEVPHRRQRPPSRARGAEARSSESSHTLAILCLEEGRQVERLLALMLIRRVPHANEALGSLADG